ncbi:MAG: SUF system NifU family Fe-S cluster assembly protein [Deltaproteobacteria bacterium]|nr:SUF system NifU family Fe-S cluster assembly protein [Deltaproteobacteria bacterium]
MNGLDELYRDVILDHFKSPRGKGILHDATIIAEGKNPLCGDELTLYVTLDGERIVQLRWDGHGCALCMASASMLAESMTQQPLDTVQHMAQAVLDMMHGAALPTHLRMGDIEVMEGVKKFPVRIKCVLLPWTTLQEGMKHHDAHTAQHVSFSY